MAAQGSEGLAGGEPQGKAAIYSVELSVFEGPLDLLLHLVRRHELDILDIPIAFVAEKYLEYLHLMRSLDLEVAGDYLVMAATLAWLKSRELLPAAPREGEAAGADDEEGEDPRAALIRRLVEYERFKNAAAELDAMPVSGRDVFARGADIDVPPTDPGLAPVTLFRLAEAYYRVLTRAKINKTHDVTIEAVTVAQRMQQLTLMLDERQEFDFEGLFLGRTWSSEPELRAMLVVTLMSVLELVKLGVARVQQVPDTDAIRVYRLVASEEARKLIETYDEEQSFGAPVEPGPAPPSEAELDALEERTLLAEALAGLSGPEDDTGVGELGALAEELDPDTLPDDPLAADTMLTDEADLGPEAIAAEAANSDPTGSHEANDELSEETGAAIEGEGLPAETGAAPEANDELFAETDAAPEENELSEETDATPEANDDLSEETGVAPEASDDLSEETDAAPEANELSEETGATPKENELSEETDAGPEVSDDLSEETDAAPEAGDELSEETDAAPEANELSEEPDAGPEASDELSEETGVMAQENELSEETGVAPEASELSAETGATPGASDEEPSGAPDAGYVPIAAPAAEDEHDVSEAPGSDETPAPAPAEAPGTDDLSEAPGPADADTTTDDGEQTP